MLTTFDPLHPVQSAILESLAAKPGQTVAELQKSIGKIHSVNVSVAHVYNVVRDLIDQQMLLKTKGKLWIHSVWIAHLQSFMDGVQRTHVQSTRIIDVPLKPGERREFVAQSLQALDPTWFQVCLDCAALSKGEAFYAYNAHTWYTLGMHEQDNRGWRSLTEHGTPCYFLCGNDTFLDRYGQKLLNIQEYRTALTSAPPFPTDGYSINVCGEYIIECVFPAAITRHFSLFFDSVRSVEQFDAELFSDVFRMKAKCKITLRRDAAEAAKVRALFTPYFSA